MASITIPTAITTTAAIIGGYIGNASESDLQTLLDDANYTLVAGQLCYNGVPILTYANGNTRYLEMVQPLVYFGAQAGECYFGDGNDAIYVYNFDTFIVFTLLLPITNISASTKKYLIIDKTNSEVFSGYVYAHGYGVTGRMFNYKDTNDNVITSTFYPTDFSYNSGTGHTPIREESASDVRYIKLVSREGQQATRMYFFDKFPRGSSNQVLHVDDKYFYMFPIDETLYTFSTTREVYCTLGIDVTSEINAQS